MDVLNGGTPMVKTVGFTTKPNAHKNVLEALGSDGDDVLTALTTDPDVALQFCQSLVQTLKTHSELAPAAAKR
jgi:hypothetical protein